eukprot:CAMPEP_0185856750 /NCGR_PEP_ID=MMETSP1354-20130828/29158_1 /TAXON_ID=708628 /ORGANISM="Erythrolobus madagascarensis, Strain CCMP3276" /LENGTH=675 /DNA_ID=CAMNT_0028559011 /DNA_START=354 /DNA_END=2381 /DNA_ORIENTATION=-
MITGAPASGKGTQCALIAAKFGVPHISTGDMLRAEVAAKTELGLKAKDFMESGALVPDDLIIDMLLARLEQSDVVEAGGGWLLDGFPRTDAQAAALSERGIEPDLVLHLDVPDEDLVARVVGRRSDPVTGAIYHLVYDKPTDEAVLNRLVQRADDTEEKVRVRLKAYHTHATKLLERYDNVVRTVDGTQDKAQVFADIESAIVALDAAQKNKKQMQQLGAMILGAPGSGKGTQCELIAGKYGLVHISTGDMLRAAVAAGTELGNRAKEFMDKGELVPDEVVIGMVEERLAEEDVIGARGWLLDGFPRTVAQADALGERGIVPDVVLKVDVPQEILVRRVVGRRSDPVTNKIYHVEFDPPEDEEVAKRLVQRADDEEHKVRTRLVAYNQYATLLEDRYAQQLAVVNGDQNKLDVLEEITAALDKTTAAKNNEKSIDRDDDDDGGSSGPTGGVGVGADAVEKGGGENKTSSSSSGQKETMSVNEFVRRAEEAFESGSLSVQDTNWSGQAGAEPARVAAGRSSYTDVLARPVLLAGDLTAFLAFAAIGTLAHRGDSSDSVSKGDVIRVALPFILGWLSASPLLGAYTSAATSSFRSCLLITLRCACVGVPVGVAVRGLATSHVPPAEFAAISIVTCTLLLAAWRTTYIAVAGPTTDGEMRRGGMLDGLSMITTLLRRW